MPRLSLRRSEPLIGVVVPAYDVAGYLPACLDSILGQSHRALDVVVVDDGSPDESGAVAEEYAARDPRVRVVHIENRGLGAARNEGLRHVRGDVLAFADSDDVVPPGAYAAMLTQLRRTGADLVTGDVARLVGDDVQRIRWMRRLHADRASVFIEQRPELLGDVFAWNKLYRREFWDGAGLSWPEGVRYEDQPTLTRAYVHARLIGVVPEVVYHWRVRDDGTSITQQRASTADLRDRWTTKRSSLATVRDFGSDKVTRVFVDRVLPGDLWRYFLQIPQADDEWWQLLVSGVREFWGGERSLTHSILPPAHRLTGWLVEQDRRSDAVAVIEQVAALAGRPLPRVTLPDGSARVDVPGLDPATVDPAALLVRPGE
ncbi:glycosyltransferase family 2 protein [Nocardioides panacisoli]|uniref:Glycosyltransferase 2-like domain-containing protein n=1 Tax=Nocardioides panacisoli TaxID=627624 RepID=A0ABP7IDQ0_9ACTN